MVTAISNTFPHIGPLTNIQPFTMRDGTTYLEQLEKMRVFLNDDVITGLNEAMEATIAQFNEGILGIDEVYQAFTTEIERQVMLINNRVGPENIQRIVLTNDYTLTIDPVWPDAHPILIQFTQDEFGGHIVTLDGVTGEYVVDPEPGTLTEFWIVPTVDGWHVWQPVEEIRAFLDITLGNVDNTADADKPVSTPLETRFRHRLYTKWDKPLDRVGAALMNLDTQPFVWVNCGSSTAAGGVVDRISQSWFTRIGHMMGQTAGYVDFDSIDSTNIPANGWYGVKAALGGTTSATYLNATKIQKINTLNPDIVSHMIGSNDWSNGTALATYKNNIRNNIEAIRNANPTTTQLLIHQQGRLDGTRAIPWKAYGVALRELAEEYPDTCVFVDLDQHFRFMGILSTNSWGLVVSDNLHLNAAGNKIVADILSDYLGLPTSQMLGVESYEATVFTGGTFDATANGHILTGVHIPPKPYIRNIHATASVFASVPSGFNDLGLFGEPALTASTSQALRVVSTSSSTHAWSGRFTVEPYATGEIRISLNIYSAPSLTVSSSAAFNSLVVTATPGF